MVILAEKAVDVGKDKSHLCLAVLNTDVGPRGEGESLSSSSVIAYGHLFGQLLHYKVVYLANYYNIRSSIWPTTKLQYKVVCLANYYNITVVYLANYYNITVVY
jgi:hypothetical protein